MVASKIASVNESTGHTADLRYLAQLNASALIDGGTAAYANQKFSVAAERFRAALADPSGEQLRALNGSYLASVKLNQLERAEQYFGQMIAYGIRERKLGMKFLFRPGSTDFWQSTQVSSLYGMWIRQAARGVNIARVCVELVGHASKTGTESFNDRLSEQRSQLIRDRMVQEVPALSSRISARGVGFRELIVGTGTDDAGDSEDRRVAFAFKDCSAK
jgi:outer membrane protein OmpA-like peptidoglycan-associated protein